MGPALSGHHVQGQLVRGTCATNRVFETLVIDWLKEASVVARRVRMTWDEVASIMDRAVGRGLTRRTVELPEALAVAEMEVDSIPESFAVAVPVCDVLEHLDDGVEGLLAPVRIRRVAPVFSADA